MASLLIKNIGTMISGDITDPIIHADTLYIEDGFIKEIGNGKLSADTVIDACQQTVIPGLIDSHVHLSVGDWTPVQNCTNWITNYLHGGTLRMVSAGELHIPGLPIAQPRADVFVALATLTRACYKDYRPGGVKVEAGTLLLVPGLKEKDFEKVASNGSKLVKFIFYPYDKNKDEQTSYLKWARKYGLKVKIHSGGVSRSGVSVPADADLLLSLKPDIAGHINGGPIPMSISDMERVVNESDCFLELAYCGNFGQALKLLKMAKESNQLHRVILGTDTPSGTGITPRGMLRLMAIVGASEHIKPEQAICMATGSPAVAHDLDSGFIAKGKPADLLILGRITGSSGKTALEALNDGHLLGISMALIDGEIVIRERSLQTPPPEIGAIITQELVR
jgi:enamidase